MKYSKEQIERVVFLRGNGFTYREISEKTGVTERSVKYWLEKTGLILKFQDGRSSFDKRIEYEINESGCHICTSRYRNDQGYMLKRFNGKRTTMIRYIYTRSFGIIPESLVVRHKCDNPSCININHLELGTVADNSKDMVARGRSLYGEKQKKVKLNENQVLDIFCNKSPYKDIAEEYDISISTVGFIKTKRSWKYLTKNLENGNIMETVA